MTVQEEESIDQDALNDIHQQIESYIHDEDMPYEEDLLRNPFAIRSWLRYFEFKKNAPWPQRLFIYQRAVKQLPRSYKLWKILLDESVNRLFLQNNSGQLKTINPDFPETHTEWQLVNSQFELCLILCNKFPVIWMDYCHFLIYQPTRITFTRRTFDRALKALPVTQHKKLWDLYLEFATLAGGDTCVRIWRRFLKIQPSQAERYCNTLLALDPPRTAEAARVLAAIIESPVKYANPNGKTVYQYWTLLCKLIIDHPHGIEMPQQDHLVPTSEFALTQRPDKLDVELILRTGIKKFSDQVGTLWNSLALWWILQNQFERARDIFEEGIRSVSTVKDFSMIFDSYAQMEEKVLATAMEDMETNDGKNPSKLNSLDIDMRLERFEMLMERRPFLVNDVLLRQNPHNVLEWQNRIKLHIEIGDKDQIIRTYRQGCKTINPHRAHGPLTEFWIEFAKYYASDENIDEARKIFEQAVQVEFKKVDDLAHVWCQWAELEISFGNYEKALEIIGRATAPLSANLDIRYNDETKSPQQRLFKSIKLWSFYVDLEESIGSIESTKAVYDRIMDLKIATPQIIINYSSFLEEQKHYEESFRVYERGIEVFGYPIAFEIWNLYLTKFIKRYGGSKLERARDLFENALEKCPPKYAKSLYVMYAKLEEDYGLARHALKIYARGTERVSPEDLFDLFLVYIAKATSFFGIVSTREIFEKALSVLPDKSAREMAIKFCEMEIKLGEVDRSRAILAYISQVCDPRVDVKFWDYWHEFEVKYGNEDTYKEMLR
ncbi:hypothetical protein BC833DRAFT_590864 [Globomyces pollinis-pini]|nr:hypothetical protein BC833DRAFT_590864 [Globomyces pollinis-pini]